MYQNIRMTKGIYKQNPAMSAVSETVSLDEAPLPCTLVLNSAAGGRKIEISPMGNTFYQPTVDLTSAGQLVLVLTAPMGFVKFTGAVADSWAIL